MTEPGTKGWKTVTRGWDNRLQGIPWDLPTHARGGIRDHIFLDNQMMNSSAPHMSATPTTKKDHFIIIGSVGGRAVKQRTGGGSIPEWFIKTEDGRKMIEEEVGRFDEDGEERPAEYLARLKEGGKKMWNQYKRENKGVGKKFRELGELTMGIGRIVFPVRA